MAPATDIGKKRTQFSMGSHLIGNYVAQRLVLTCTRDMPTGIYARIRK